jgi:hypothetical protein
MEIQHHNDADQQYCKLQYPHFKIWLQKGYFGKESEGSRDKG